MTATSWMISQAEQNQLTALFVALISAPLESNRVTTPTFALAQALIKAVDPCNTFHFLRAAQHMTGGQMS